MKIIRLDNYQFIKVSGPDSEAFLQGQLSCDVSSITEHHSSFAVCCDPKGRIQAFFRLFKIEQDFYIRIIESMAEHLLAHLGNYIVFSKAELSICKDLTAFGAWDSSNSPTVKDGDILADFVDGRYEIYSRHEHECHGELADWRLDTIKSGVPEIYPETLGQFTPHNLNLQCLQETLSFDKGCYTGQEIIARMHYRGTLKQHMYLAKIETNAKVAPYTLVYTQADLEKSVGHIVDSVNVDNQLYALISMKDQFAHDKTVTLQTTPKACFHFLKLPYNLS